jgi:tetratricopeptide (TPR) repeat protein
LVVLVLGFFSSLSINKIHKGKLNTFEDLVFTKEKKDLYKDDRNIMSLASGTGRKEFWIAAINGFKSSPILGVGIGNWKIISKRNLEKTRKDSNHFYARRVHNDFLQVLSEIGIFGFIIFLGLFGLVYYLFLTTLFKNNDKEKKLISLICLSGFTAYSLDSLINFPSERTPIQILGFILVVIALVLQKRKNDIPFPKYFKFGLIGVSLVLIYINNQMFVSAKYQMIVRNNIRGKNILKDKYKVSYDQMNNLYPSFPKLNFMGQPIDYAKAVLAYSEGKYIQTMEHLDLAIKESPNSLEHYAFKSLIYRSNDLFKNQDSSVYYARKAFDQRPGLINQYRILKRYYTTKKDTANLLEVINKHLNFLNGNENVWIDKINFYLKYPKDLNKASELIDSAKLMVPESKRIQGLRIVNNNLGTEVVANANSHKNKNVIELQAILNKASKLFSQKKFIEAYNMFYKGLELAPTNEEIRLSLALTDIKLKRYNSAIEKLNLVIESEKVNNGKPEYNRGLCYLRLNKKKLAGKDFRTSFDKGFPMAKQLDKKFLNY